MNNIHVQARFAWGLRGLHFQVKLPDQENYVSFNTSMGDNWRQIAAVALAHEDGARKVPNMNGGDNHYVRFDVEGQSALLPLTAKEVVVFHDVLALAAKVAAGENVADPEEEESE